MNEAKQGFNFHSIGIQFALLAGGSVTFVAVMLGVFFSYKQYSLLKTQYMEQGQTVSGILADTLGRELSVVLALGEPGDEDKDRFKNILNDGVEKTKMPLNYILLLSKDGEAWAGTNGWEEYRLQEEYLVNRVKDFISNSSETESLKNTRHLKTASGHKIIEVGAVAITSMGVPEGAVVLGIDVARMKKTILKQAWQGLVMTLLFIIVISAIIYGVVIGSLTKPVKSLVEVSLAIAHGDLSKEIDTGVAGAKHELGQLAQAFKMSHSFLSEVASSLNQQADKIFTSSRSLANITQQSTSTISQLSTVVSQISQSAVSVAQNTQSASSMTRAAGDEARKGSEGIKQLASQMDTVQSAVNHAANVSTALGNSSARIGEIVDVITKIADQTNLLSLNAAIEAARAGESGRGFAVVADEIRKLAEHSGSSALEIAKLINEVQANTATVVEVMERGREAVKSGGVLMSQVEKSFTTILDAVANAARQVEQIATAAEETAASTEEASASSEEQTAAIEEIAAAAQLLSQTAEELKVIVNKFKTK